MKTYLALITTQHGERNAYICEAPSKKIMKQAGMNMRLEWTPVKDFSEAKTIIACEGYVLKNATVC